MQGGEAPMAKERGRPSVCDHGDGSSEDKVLANAQTSVAQDRHRESAHTSSARTIGVVSLTITRWTLHTITQASGGPDLHHPVGRHPSAARGEVAECGGASSRA